MRNLAFLVTATAVAISASGTAWALDRNFGSEKGPVHVSTVVSGLTHPWGFVFLPDGSMLVTEREGALRHVSPEGAVSEPLEGTPKVAAQGQGGLLDVALDPGFAENRLVYLSFAEEDGDVSGTAVARGTLRADAGGLDDVEVIFRQQPKVASNGHFGSRLVFDREGMLFVTMGDRQSADYREQAQDLGSHIGKIVRIAPDGSVPPDNPFVATDGALPEIWAYGVRNVQAAALNPETGLLWEIEHGPRGGDELNVIRPGENYGWPIVTLGVNYDGSTIGEGVQSADGMVDAIRTWTPVIAPSGMAFYAGGAIAGWRGNLFVGGLASTALVRLELDGETVVHEERLLEPLGLRIRDVAEGPDGAIYVATDEADGEILRIAPAD